MKHYLFIESEGSFAAADAPQFFALAREIKQQGDTVEIFLVQNGVMPARAGSKADGLSAALQAGIAVMADEMSMRERALKASDLVTGVKPAKIGTVVERTAAGWNVIWH
ncbi:MAG: DsrE family protein [Alphaproteobacteria bacterium]|nr:DsrE family protein [Alphaproteobacteria bacterium]